MTGDASLASGARPSGSVNRAGRPLTTPFSSKCSRSRPRSLVSPLCWMPYAELVVRVRADRPVQPFDHTHQPESNVSAWIG